MPPSEPAALRDAVLALRNDRAGTDALGAGGRAYAESKLAPAKALLEYEAFVERILRAPGQH